MKPFLVKYSKFSNFKSKVLLYISFIILCSLLGGAYGLFLPFVPLSTVKLLLLPILFIGLIGIWMLPEKDKYFENEAKIGLYIFLGFWMIWPPYLSLIRLPGDPWMSPQRILIYAFLLLALLMFSVSKNAKQVLKEKYHDNKWLFKAFIILIIASFMSIFFSDNIEFSTSILIKEILYYYLVFIIAATVLTTAKQVKTIFLICIISALCLAVTAFYETTLQQTVWSYLIPRNFFAGTEDIQTILTPKFRFGYYRVKGSSLTSLEYAELLSFTIPMCLYFLLDSKGKFLKILMAITIIILFYAIIVSRSRLGLVGAIIGLSTYSFMISLRNWHLNKGSLIGPAMLTLYPAGLLTLGLLIGFSTTLTNMVLGGGGHASSTGARTAMWEKGIPIIAERPLFGYGIGQGGAVLNYRNPSGVVTIDSYLLSITLETGIVGVLSFIFIFAYASIKSSKAYIHASRDDAFGKMGAAFASIFLAFLVIKIVLSQRYNHTLIFLLLGIITHYKLIPKNLK